MLWALPGELQRGCTPFPEGSLQLTHSGVPGEVPHINSVRRHILFLRGTCLQLGWVHGSSPSAWQSGVLASDFQVRVLILKRDVSPSPLLSGAKASEYWDSCHHRTADLKKKSSSSYSVPKRDHDLVRREKMKIAQGLCHTCSLSAR